MSYPLEIVTSLEELLKLKYFIQRQVYLPKRTVHTILAGKHSSKLRGRGLDFEEVRAYVPGDDIRNIDWKVTARKGITYSKVYNEEKERPVFTVIDQQSGMFFGTQRYVKSVIAAQVAALSGFWTLKKGDRFGGIVFNDTELEFVSPKRSMSLIEHYLRLVTDYNQRLPEMPFRSVSVQRLNEVLHRTSMAVTHDYVLTIISDFSVMDQDTEQLLMSLSRHNDVILVHIYDPFEVALQDKPFIFSDGEYQTAWKHDKRKAGQLYNEQFTQLKTKLRDLLQKYGIPHLLLDTYSSAEQQLTELLKQS
ncbi:DUF58 domain-containing protein [Limibacter armeniacum]|uniref:DUF58 domain-containing protein n=1 Tax=Limibacter armeniacum TaxID=466084 RepID=UPI002FE5C56A